MRLRLKEDPREWRKFAGAFLIVLWLLLGVLAHRQIIPAHSWRALALASLLVACAALLRPRAFRGPYRVAMKFSFHVGQATGRILLALVFLVVIVPMALVLRLCGTDLLRLRRDRGRASYWHAAPPPSSLDRQF